RRRRRRRDGRRLTGARSNQEREREEDGAAHGRPCLALDAQARKTSLVGDAAAAVHPELERAVAVADRDLDRVLVDAVEREHERTALRRREAIRAGLRDGILPAHLYAFDREVPATARARPRARAVDL